MLYMALTDVWRPLFGMLHDLSAKTLGLVPRLLDGATAALYECLRAARVPITASRSSERPGQRSR